MKNARSGIEVGVRGSPVPLLVVADGRPVGVGPGDEVAGDEVAGDEVTTDGDGLGAITVGTGGPPGGPTVP
ncbi:hypothetical protein [Micromonospora sp. NPDC023737]|uniref:hypothetical protein n=1 Tax=unclassified Micromonospora TaxID=2617518 RepID=UPI0033C8A4B3